MRTKTIDGHTFCSDLLTSEGWIIDIGCRGFELEKWAAENKPRLQHEDFNYNTYCVDIEDMPVPEGNIVTVFKHAALSITNGKTEAFYFGNGTGNFIKGINETPGDLPDRPLEIRTVDTITLDYIYEQIGTNIDLLKLDAEGVEYFVLQDFKPIPKMLSVETHEHCHGHLHSKYWDSIFEALSKDYHCNLYIREWPRYKFMDCLFIRKDLI